MNNRLPRHEIVLLGAGHTHAHIIRMWRMNAFPRTRLTCISDFSVATYSGMLPAVLAHQYPRSAMEIDLRRLTAACGVRLIIDEVTGIDLERHLVRFADRSPVPYSLLSVGVGSRPSGLNSVQGNSVVPIKPMQTFLDRLTRFANAYRERHGDRPVRLAVVGGGVGGIEVSLCIPHHLQSLGLSVGSRHLITSSTQPAPGLQPGTLTRIERVLDREQIDVRTGSRVSSVVDQQITFESGQTLECDLILWATSAEAPDLLSRLDLPRDERGFLWTNPELQSEGSKRIFAVGDSGTIRDSVTPKAGVYAVRQGPVLWKNLHAAIAGKPLSRFRPQKSFLKLVNTGDGGAIGELRGRSFQGRFAWKWKDRIDTRFMEKHRDLEPMEMTSEPDDEFGPRCLGCGGKAGAGLLKRVLDRIRPDENESVDCGLQEQDDAAVVSVTDSQVTMSVDFFAVPLDDAWLMGRVAALNSISDLYVMGSRPQFAMAIITLPEGPENRMEETLEAVLLGCQEEFRKAGVTLIGGHTIEGPRLEVGFSITGGHPGRTTQAPKPGDRILMTRKLGTGAILAAHMQAAASFRAVDGAISNMLGSNQVALQLFEQRLPHAMKDITGFGLAGHMLELLGDHECDATISLKSLPLIDDAEPLFEVGVESTLASQNRWIEDRVIADASMRSQPRYASLFDPLTSGGLLMAVPPESVTKACQLIEDETAEAPTEIGELVSRIGQRPIVTIVE